MVWGTSHQRASTWCWIMDGSKTVSHLHRPSARDTEENPSPGAHGMLLRDSHPLSGHGLGQKIACESLGFKGTDPVFSAFALATFILRLLGRERNRRDTQMEP